VIEITPLCSGRSYIYGMAISSRFATAPSPLKIMTVATAPARTRKPRTTPANLIAAEFAARQPLPAAQPATAPAAPIPASPVILVFILAVAATLLFRLALAAVPVINYGIKKLVKFVATQRGGRIIDFRIYDPIFG
jgi:hypothetical protein